MAEEPPGDGESGAAEIEAYAATDLALEGASRAKADAFLAEQIALVRLQREHLHEQRALAVSHLKWRRYGDWMRSGWQTLIGIVAAAIFIGLCVAVWKASDARGLVIESFSVPPDFAARGIGGDQLAGDMMSKVAAIRAFGNSHSYGTSDDVHSGGEEDVKVEIPQTGVSIVEVWRLMRALLGRERHVTGDLRELGDGKIALVVDVTGAPSIVVTGAPADLDRIEQDAAEQLHGILDPINHSIYLAEIGRVAEGIAAAKDIAEHAPNSYLRAIGYSLWSDYTRTAEGDPALARARANLAMAADPRLVFAPVEQWRVDDEVGDPEDLLKRAKAVQAFKADDQMAQLTREAFVAIRDAGRDWIAVTTGDFANAGVGECRHSCPLSRRLLVQATIAARGHDPAAARTMIAQSRAIGDAYAGDIANAQGWTAMQEGAWDEAALHWRAAQSAWQAKPPLPFDGPKFAAVLVATHFRPWLALSLAQLGDVADAHHEIDGTPRDCYDCARVRGLIDAIQKNWGGAFYWFARAAAQAPSVPFADTDWGAMLLREGKYDAAIAKFARAHAKGPHFADPLELWGEALIAKNRSDLALAKFADAAHDAPNWGRLHLEWGEALLWTGDRAGAREQFARASGLDLTATEQRALARMRGAAADSRSGGTKT